MSLAKTQHTTNTVLGAGEVFFDEEDAGGNLTGERYLGDSVSATIGSTTERTQVFSGDGPIAEALVDIVRSVERTMGFSLRDMSLENWDLFILGAGVSDSAAVAAARVTGADAWAFKAMKGRWFQVGATAANPSGIGPVKDVTVDDKVPGAFDAGKDALIITSAAAAPANNNTITRADNYQVDTDTGRIYIEEDAAGFVDGTTYYVHYVPPAALDAGKRKIAKTGEIRQRRGAVRYIETPAAGKGRNVYARRVVLAPSGEAAVKSRDTEQQLAFTGAIQAAPAGSVDLMIDGEPA